MKIIYKLTKEDMTTLGHMGSSPTTEWTQLYTTAKKAQKAAEKDYGFNINWRPGIGNGPIWNSGDFGHVMYNIREIEVL